MRISVWQRTKPNNPLPDMTWHRVPILRLCQKVTLNVYACLLFQMKYTKTLLLSAALNVIVFKYINGVTVTFASDAFTAKSHVWRFLWTKLVIALKCINWKDIALGKFGFFIFRYGKYLICIIWRKLISPWTKWPPFPDDFFEWNFMNERLFLSFKFHCGLFLKFQLTISKHSFK